MKADTTLHSHSSYLTPSQIADLLSVTTRTIRNMTAKGLLPVVRLTGKTVRYPRAGVEASLAALTVGTAR